MLLELNIRNFAIIDRLNVTFGPGFNVLTGETGAGKSIIIDAVGLLLGERARPELIRNGEEEATVEALLDLAGQDELQTELVAAGFEAAEELLVRRVVARSGKNRVYLNGSLATLAQLQPLVTRLVTIYGQHEHQSLLRAETHLSLLDRFAGLAVELVEFRSIFDERNAVANRLHQLDRDDRDRQQRLDLLAFQCREIDAAALQPGEEETLVAERLLLQHAERLAAATGRGYEELYGAEGAACERLGGVARELEDLTKIDPRLGPLAESIRSALYTLEDAAGQLRTLAERAAFDPERQQQVEERLTTLATLKRKYGPGIEQILHFRKTAGEELGELGDVEGSRTALRSRLSDLDVQLHAAGVILSARRQEAAHNLQNAVESELHQLAMPRARFEVRLLPVAEVQVRGYERCEFFLAPNPGEEPKPLARIASGGELSRIMLALKRAAPEGDGLTTLIFDEVDAGIGGVAASAVGEKLRRAATGVQVLCITHLPQVAAYAERHYRVEKQEANGRTFTGVRLLEGEARVEEMARMLGGARITERTLEHARELIVHSAQFAV